MDERPDQALVAEMARGDAAALRTLYLRYEVATFNLILRLAGNRETAEDLMQETFTRVWRTAGSYRPDKGPFRSWLYTIALNLTRNELARKRYRVHHLEAEAAEGLASTADAPDMVLMRAE